MGFKPWQSDIKGYALYIPRSRTVESYGNSVLTFGGTAILFFTVAVPAYVPTNIVVGFPFLHTSLVAQMVKNPPAMQETWV